LKLTQGELAEQAGTVSKRTIEKAEKGVDRVQESKLRLIAKALGVSLDDVVLPDPVEGRPGRSNTQATGASPAVSDGNCGQGGAEKLRFFGLNQRDEAFDVLIQWQKQFKASKARVISFTGHTLDSLFLGLLNVGIKNLDVFLGTKSMARRLVSSRQLELFDTWWGPHIADLYHHVRNGQITFRYYDTPPSFTGVALDESVYLINNFVWMPTLNWLRELDPQAYHAHWESININRKPSYDEYTMNGINMPSILIAKRHDEPASDAFRSLSSSFEVLWKMLETDLTRPQVPGQTAYPPIEEMQQLQTRLMAEERRKADKGRAKLDQ
jgi:transcriptional regulator with XRE-family HTH domain